MTKHRNVIGAALLASAAFVTGSANAQTVTCSASGPFGGRQLATITVSPRDPSVCVRYKLGAPAAPGTPDCWSVVRNSGFPCFDAQTGSPNIVDAN